LFGLAVAVALLLNGGQWLYGPAVLLGGWMVYLFHEV
jgi:hypothetical protein